MTAPPTMARPRSRPFPEFLLATTEFTQVRNGGAHHETFSDASRMRDSKHPPIVIPKQFSFSAVAVLRPGTYIELPPTGILEVGQPATSELRRQNKERSGSCGDLRYASR